MNAHEIDYKIYGEEMLQLGITLSNYRIFSGWLARYGTWKNFLRALEDRRADLEAEGGRVKSVVSKSISGEADSEQPT